MNKEWMSRVLTFQSLFYFEAESSNNRIVSAMFL